MNRHIEQDYALRRQKAEHNAQLKKEKAYATIPRLKEIDDICREIALNAGAIIGNDGSAQRELARVEIAALRAEQRRLLCEEGFGSLEPEYECSLCNDTGYSGDIIKAPCVCYRKQLLKQRYASSTLNDEQTFENFDAKKYTDPQQKHLMLGVKKVCLKYALDFPNNDVPNLLFMGKTGLGKTFMLNCLAHSIAQKGYTVAKLTAYNLINEILNGIKTGENTNWFFTADLLCIDDLGTEPIIQNISREYVFSILNERQNAKLHTVIATNLDYEGIQQIYGERVFSRLVSPKTARVIQLEGKDLRLT